MDVSPEQGLFLVIKCMTQHSSNVHIQLKGVKCIGDVAQYGNRQCRKRNKGQAHMEHFDRSVLTALQAALLKTQASGASESRGVYFACAAASVR